MVVRYIWTLLWVVILTRTLWWGYSRWGDLSEHWDRIYAREKDRAQIKLGWLDHKYRAACRPEDHRFRMMINMHECGLWEAELASFDVKDVAFHATIQEHKDHLPDWLKSPWFSQYESVSFIEIVRSNMGMWTLAFISFVGFGSLVVVMIMYLAWKYIPASTPPQAAPNDPAPTQPKKPNRAIGMEEAETRPKVEELQEEESDTGLDDLSVPVDIYPTKPSTTTKGRTNHRNDFLDQSSPWSLRSLSQRT